LPLIEIYEEKNNLFLILEFMEGKDLQHLLKSQQTLTESQIYGIFHQIFQGVRFLHHFGVMHRDLKPENILLATHSVNSDLKIADFSLSENFIEKKKFSKPCGTPGYMAPEILSGNEYDEKVDVYSLGLILYIL